MTFTVRIETETEGWLVGQLSELPAVLAQGRTEAELLTELRDALDLYLAFQRERTSESPSEGVRFATLNVE